MAHHLQRQRQPWHITYNDNDNGGTSFTTTTATMARHLQRQRQRWHIIYTQFTEKEDTQLTFTCPKLAIETLEKDFENVKS